MLLETLSSFAHKGARAPLDVWQGDLSQALAGIADEFRDIEADLHEGTPAMINVKRFLKEVGSQTPNELEFARSLAFFVELFRKNPEPEYQELINQFILDAFAFCNAAQSREYYREIREEMKGTMNEQDQRNFDLRLFENEGMMYCLEYYLALYKQVIDAKTPDSAWSLIADREINLGFGKLPGLMADMESDEVLHKFVYRILDNRIRVRLTQSYFYAKIVVLDIKNKQQTMDHAESLKAITSSLRDFIIVLFEEFRLEGIERLSSYFFTPYGSKPLIVDIVL